MNEQVSISREIKSRILCQLFCDERQHQKRAYKLGEKPEFSYYGEELDYLLEEGCTDKERKAILSFEAKLFLSLYLEGVSFSPGVSKGWSSSFVNCNNLLKARR